MEEDVMKKNYFKFFLIGVLLVSNINTLFAAQEPDEFQGYIKPLLLKIIPLIKPNTLLAAGPIEFNIDPDNIIYTAWGDKKYTAAFIERAVTLSIMAYEGAFLQANSSIIIYNLSKGVLPVLNEMKIRTNDAVSDETGMIMLDKMGVETLILGKIIEKDGKWILTLSVGESGFESDPLDREAQLRLIRKSVENFEKDDLSKEVITGNDEKQSAQATVPAPIIDRASKLSFRNTEIRPAVKAAVIGDDLYVSAYDRAINSVSASTRPAIIVFSKSKIPKVINSGHTDSINGFIPGVGVFYSFADDGLLICHSSSDYTEQYRLNNGRPIKTVALYSDGLIITNPGNPGSKTFDTKTRAECKEPISKSTEVADQKFRERIEIKNGLVSVYDSSDKELLQLGYYTDGQYGLIFNERNSYAGSETIERHLSVTDYGQSPRFWAPDDRKMRVDNTA